MKFLKEKGKSLNLYLLNYTLPLPSCFFNTLVPEKFQSLYGLNPMSGVIEDSTGLF